jgi:hypothetical protein
MYSKIMMESGKIPKFILVAIILTVIIGMSASLTLQQLIVQQAEAAKKTDNGLIPIATSGDSVYVAWDSNKTGNREILFRVSSDGGKTFDDKINISNSTNGRSDMQDVAASGNNVFVTWCDDKTGDMEIYIRKSSDGGKTFGNTTMLESVGTLPSNIKYIPYGQQDTELIQIDTNVALSDNNTYATWWDNKTGNWEVLFTRSIDGGQTFEDTINLSNSSTTRSERAQLAADGNNVYVTWWEEPGREPTFRSSNDNGETFGPILRLAANGTIGSGKE